MPVKINISKSTVLAKVMGDFKEILPPLVEEIKNDCNRYCKFAEGHLTESADTNSKPEEGKIIWQTPYARRQYWEIRTAYRTVNPEARWRWCEYAKQHHMEQWNRQAQKLMEGR